MLFLYRLCFPLVLIAFLPDLIAKYIRRSGYKKTYPERFGFFRKERIAELLPWRSAVWIHAVSVGETNLALTVLKEWTRREPDRKFILSTTTTTAQEIARNKAPAQVKVIFCPLDWFPFVRRTMRLIRPVALVLFETELWPELIVSARRYGAKLALVNTRISDKSFRGYLRFRFFFAPVLNRFDVICAQTDLDRERLEEICPMLRERLSVCGNIKFDQTPPAGPGFDYKSVFGPDPAVVVLAASTHSPEEPLILDAWLAAKKTCPASKLVIVPRHAERGGDIEAMIQARKLSYLRRSSGSKAGDVPDVLLADTTGELPGFIKSSDLVVMGKTFAGNDEGQNIIEPAVMGKPVICGPKLRNFRQALDILCKGNAVRRLENDSELTDALLELMQRTEQRFELGERARVVMLKNKGALDRTLNAVELLCK